MWCDEHARARNNVRRTLVRVLDARARARFTEACDRFVREFAKEAGIPLRFLVPDRSRPPTELGHYNCAGEWRDAPER